MRVLITTDAFSPMVNGVVTSILNLKKGLETLGHEVRILALSQSHVSRADGDVTYLGSYGAGAIYPQARWRFLAGEKYVRALIRWKPDVVHTQNEFSTFTTAKYIAAQCGAPLIHTYHTAYEDYTHYFCPSKRLGRRIVARLTRYRVACAAYVIAPTAKIRQMLYTYKIRPAVRVIPTGIDLARFYAQQDSQAVRAGLGIPPDAKVALYVGRLGREKNVTQVIDAFARAGDGAYLVLAGDGPYRESLEKQAQASGAGSRILFAGMVDRNDVAAYYHMADVFVNASTSETQGLTVIEALASSLPVVCLRDECFSRVVENGLNGFQCADGNELTQKIALLMDDDALRAQLAAGAAESSQKFSAETFARAAEQLYFSCLHKSRRPVILPRPVKGTRN